MTQMKNQKNNFYKRSMYKLFITYRNSAEITNYKHDYFEKISWLKRKAFQKDDVNVMVKKICGDGNSYFNIAEVCIRCS